MGLDMYLIREIRCQNFISGNEVTGRIKLFQKGAPLKVDVKRVVSITEEILHWRKTYSIHGWFVHNVPSAKDGGKCIVEHSKLMEFKKLCEDTLAAYRKWKRKGYAGYPGEPGVKILYAPLDDRYFYEDLKRTVKELRKLDPQGCYYYESSW